MESNKISESLLKLLKIAEDLLFSLPLSTDIIEKYESIRRQVFLKCNIEYTQISLGVYPKIDPKAYTHIIVKEIRKFLNFYEEILRNCEKINENLSFSLCLQPLLKKPLINYEDQKINPYESPENYQGIISETENRIKSSLFTIEQNTNIINNHIQDQDLKKKQLLEQIIKENANKNIFFWQDALEKEQEALLKEKEKCLTQESAFNNLKIIQDKEIEIILQERNIYKKLSDQLKYDIDMTKNILQDEIIMIKE